MLFDRPLHRDPLLLLFAAVVLIAAVISGIDNIDPGTAYNPERAGNIAGTVIKATLLSFVVLAFIPAAIRRDWRISRERDARQPAQVADGAGGEGGPGAGRTGSKLVHRERGWTDAAPRRMDIGRPTDEAGNPYLAPGLSLEVSTRRTIRELPVHLTWQAPNADSVRISELPGTYPASGSVDVYLPTTRDIVVTASNRGGHVEKRTHVIQVLPTPTLEVVRTPAPPSIRLHANVNVGLNWSQEQVLTRLDAVLDEQERRRVARAPELPDELRLQDVLASLRTHAAALSGWRPLSFPQAAVRQLRITARERMSAWLSPVVGPTLAAVQPLHDRWRTWRERPRDISPMEPAVPPPSPPLRPLPPSPPEATQPMSDPAHRAAGHVIVVTTPQPHPAAAPRAVPVAPATTPSSSPSGPPPPPPAPMFVRRDDPGWGPVTTSTSSRPQDRSTR